MLKMVDGTGIIGVDMVCPLGVSTPQPPNYDKVELEGAGMLVLPNSLDAPLERLELGGKTEQVQTTGKNLIDYRNTVVGLLNFIDGSFSDTYHKYFTTEYIEIESGDYIISHNSMVGIQSYALYDINNKTYVSGKSGNNKVNIAEKCFIRISFSTKPETDVSANPIDYAKKCDIQLEKGASATPYEPHTGNKPSPSPEYPQEIKNSGKWNEDARKYEVKVKVAGKNLLDIKDITSETPQWTEIPCLIKNNIYIKSNNSTALVENNQARLVVCFKDGTSRVMYDNSMADGLLFKVNSENSITMIKVRGTHIKSGAYSDIQVEYGNEPTSYEPYKEQNLTLTSDRPITKWDRLVEQGGQIGWLYGGIVIDRFDGQSNKISIANKQGDVQNFSIQFDNVANGNGNADIFVDKYRAVRLSYTKAEYGICCNWNDGVKYFSAPNENITTVDEFKAWLIDNPLKITYETTKTEFVPLPQSEQNAIRALTTYYPTTVITADVGEVDPDIKVTYRKEI